LGLISFGGPAGQIAISMHQELVEKARWISERRFLHALNYAMCSWARKRSNWPSYWLRLCHRTLGGICAGMLLICTASLAILNLFLAVALYSYGGALPVIAGIYSNASSPHSDSYSCFQERPERIR